MFKQIVTLIRGTSYEASEAALLPHTQTILRQQIRDCAQALAAARYAVAVAQAQHAHEENSHKRILERIADLEARAIAAMEQGKDALAHEAAESIAVLEQERDSSVQVQQAYRTEIGRLKGIIRKSEFRLRDLERGQKLTAATAKAQKLREHGSESSLSTFAEAEATLNRLRERQTHFDLTMDALDDMDRTRDPSTITEKLAEAGCGPALKTRAEDVLKRLRERHQPASA
ncbi:PspA/IM30 family protein [Aestuariivirga sp.]|uniref:PspA/IM30 family protein n=1 Tax=Aestuariivirga sp. TaxID=2650926 RepID=UPI0039E61CDD